MLEAAHCYHLLMLYPQEHDLAQTNVVAVIIEGVA